ncbi:MAG: type II toxin-antitoxin system PemK/MazF family toxin [bacterium]|nr:type II toxin-antitoxin system PemK/MazF family toxin [bacterium]
MQRFSKDYPKRGQIYITDLDPSFGREIHKKRPVLIVSSNTFNKGTPYVVVIPVSSIVPNQISIDIVPLGKVSGIHKNSVLLPLFIRSIDKDRLVKRVGSISREKLIEVEEALKLVLGMVKLD